MSSRPVRKKVPTTKLSADNAGELELSSHRTLVATAASSAPQALPPTTSEPQRESSNSSPADVAPAAQPAPSPRPSRLGPPSRLSAKRPWNPFVLDSETDTDPELVPDNTPIPKAKKAKASPEGTSKLRAEVSIISIDDVEDPRDERLNKSDPTADIREFFIAVRPGEGEDKNRMKCKLCA
jgi:hypothetical protein